MSETDKETGEYLAPYKYAQQSLANALRAFGVTWKEACKALTGKERKNFGDERGKGRNVSAQEWVNLKKKKKNEPNNL